MEELEHKNDRVDKLTKEILSVINRYGVIGDILPKEAICAVTIVFMSGYKALKIDPKALKNIFQIMINDYSQEYEEGRCDEKE